MSIRTIYTAATYAPELVRDRYVRFAATRTFCWIERGEDPRWDIRQGLCEEDDIPAQIAAEAKHRAGMWPPYVEWPFSSPTARDPADGGRG